MGSKAKSRVALQVDIRSGYGRKLLRGISAFCFSNGGWEFYRGDNLSLFKETGIHSINKGQE